MNEVYTISDHTAGMIIMLFMVLSPLVMIGIDYVDHKMKRLIKKLIRKIRA